MGGFKVRNNATSHTASWIFRQITDRYVIQSKIDNYRSRSAYKLIELDDKYLIFRKNQTVVEFGCYPGGWAQIALERTLTGASNSRVIGIDKLQIDPIPNYTFIKGDINDGTTHAQLLSILDGTRADVVLCDLAPNCTGIKKDDHLNSAELCLQATSLMEKVSHLKDEALYLRELNSTGVWSIHSSREVEDFSRVISVGGTFVVKIFMGGQLENYKTYLRSLFELVNSAKPKACRSESKEMYFVCRRFMGLRDIRGDVQTQGSFYPKEGRL